MSVEDSSATAAIRICSASTEVGQISSTIPLMPTRTIERATSPARESRWIYESKLTSPDIEAHIEGLLSLIEEHRTDFESLPKDCEIDIWCTISTEREFVGLSLSRSILRRAAAFGLEIIFGIYRGDKSETH